MPTHYIDINCDMGEGIDNDAALMPFISSANIACGLHAGDEATMQRTCALAAAQGVAIGAHPGFNDREHFGRRELQLAACEVFDLVSAQVMQLKTVAEKEGAVLQHVKPHGALYNMSAREAELAYTIAGAVAFVDNNLTLVGLSGSHSITEAKALGLKTASEAFADRTYQNDGSLTPRNTVNALIADAAAAARQVLQLVQQQSVTTLSANTIAVKADTICLHGDGPHAVAFAQHIYQTLQQHNIDIRKK